MTALPPEVPEGRYPLLLAPTGQRGWFGGVGLRAADPVQVAGGVTLAEAGMALQAAFEGEEPVLVAAIVPIRGPGDAAHVPRLE
jgi:hypothetical protein